MTDERAGSMGSVLAVRDFRILWLAALGSASGGWMQGIVLAAFVYDTTGDPFLTALVGFCGMIPHLVFALPGGVMADHFDRRRLVLLLTAEQLLCSLALAWIATDETFSRPLLFAAVLLVGTGAALESPAMMAIPPTLVGPQQLAGAVALTSVSINVSRVVGPAVGALVYAEFGASWVFLANAATYGFMLVGLGRVTIPRVTQRSSERIRDRVSQGFRIARSDRVVRRCIVTMTWMGVVSTPFIALLPVMASEQWDILPRSAVYGAVFATFGVGAIAGSVLPSTVFRSVPPPRLVRRSFAGFAVVLALWVSVADLWLVLSLALVLGVCHYTLVTSISTIFQSRLDHAVRGRVGSIWIFAAYGSVPIGSLLGGLLVDVSSIAVTMYVCAVLTASLVWYADLRDHSPSESADSAAD